MSEIDARYIKHGIWTNVDHGSVMGRTITTNSRIGAVVIAALAILVTVSTSRLWELVLFAVHQYRSKPSHGDGFFHQQQVLLRSTPTPNSFLADQAKLWWLWRKKVNGTLRRSWFLVTVAQMFAVGTLIAGIFSSYVVSNDYLTVLTKNPSCGPLDIRDIYSIYGTTKGQMALAKYKSNVITRSLPFAQDCYQNSSSLPARCHVFTNPDIPLSYQKIQCPFDESICLNSTSIALSIDSGFIDANEVFGWNLLSHDRVIFRRKITCAALQTEGYQSAIDASLWPYADRATLAGEEMLLGFYGSLITDGNVSNTPWANATVAQNLLNSNITADYGFALGQHHIAPAFADWTSFEPIPALRTTDADLTLIMLTKNQMKYQTPVDDPVFSAHEPFIHNLVAGGNETVYLSDWPNSIIACKQQYQFCAANRHAKDTCSELTAHPGSISSTDFPGASAVQVAGLQLLANASFMFDVSDAIFDSPLLASSLEQDNKGYIMALPDDQWMQEVVAWEKFIWASMQIYAIDYAAGHSVQTPELRDFVSQNLDAGCEALCRAQRVVKPGGLVNINVFGLALIIGVTCFVTVLDLVLLKFMIFLKRFKATLAPGIDRWIQDGVFQLQRKAHESYNGSIWERVDKEIPTTTGPEPLRELPIEPRRMCCRNCAAEHGKNAPSSTNSRTSTDISDSVTMLQPNNIEQAAGKLRHQISTSSISTRQ